MKKVTLVAAAAAFLALGLAACSPSEKTQEAVTFQQFCDQNKGVQECIDYRANTMGGQ